jgi:hypothetical protein
MKYKIKIHKKDLPKRRIPVAPPQITHKDKSKYHRQDNKDLLDKELEDAEKDRDLERDEK